MTTLTYPALASRADNYKEQVLIGKNKDEECVDFSLSASTNTLITGQRQRGLLCLRAVLVRLLETTQPLKLIVYDEDDQLQLKQWSKNAKYRQLQTADELLDGLKAFTTSLREKEKKAMSEESLPESNTPTYLLVMVDPPPSIINEKHGDDFFDNLGTIFRKGRLVKHHVILSGSPARYSNMPLTVRNNIVTRVVGKTGPDNRWQQFFDGIDSRNQWLNNSPQHLLYQHNQEAGRVVVPETTPEAAKKRAAKRGSIRSLTAL